ncbi:MAG: hypothetical protein GXY44_09205 [Phycisphaerales bacterium]|nr:hypothetical protein [Phycisphaerales bacterium]
MPAKPVRANRKAVGTPIPASAFTDNFRQTDRQRMEHPSRILGQMGTIKSAEGMFWPSQPSQNRLALVCPRACWLPRQIINMTTTARTTVRVATWGRRRV